MILINFEVSIEHSCNDQYNIQSFLHIKKHILHIISLHDLTIVVFDTSLCDVAIDSKFDIKKLTMFQ